MDWQELKLTSNISPDFLIVLKHPVDALLVRLNERRVMRINVNMLQAARAVLDKLVVVKQDHRAKHALQEWHCYLFLFRTVDLVVVIVVYLLVF